MKILIVDSDGNNTQKIKKELELIGHTIAISNSAESALKMIKKEAPAVVISELNFIGTEFTGIDLIQEINDVDCYKVLMSEKGSFSSAIKAVKSGAYDFVPKPLNLAELRSLIAKIKEEKALKDESSQLRLKNEILAEAAEIRTKNEKMKRCVDQAIKIAKIDSTVMISGESGTGKSYLAKLIHKESGRSNGAFVHLNCATLSPGAIDNELFGYVKDSVPGAVKDKFGRLELAEGGTIFLEEISEISQLVQMKLLRFLETKEFERNGDPKVRKGNVRIITSSSKSLEKEVQSGNFREDLFFRLNVTEIRMPTLKERQEDIIDLANAYLGRAFIVNGGDPRPLSVEAKMILQKYNWPGNVRELQNVLERAAVVCASEVVQVCDLPDRIVSKVDSDIQNSVNGTSGLSLDDMEKEHIKKVLEISNTLEEAATVLGINMSTLWRKRKKFGME